MSYGRMLLAVGLGATILGTRACSNRWPFHTIDNAMQSIGAPSAISAEETSPQPNARAEISLDSGIEGVIRCNYITDRGQPTVNATIVDRAGRELSSTAIERATAYNHCATQNPTR